MSRKNKEDALSSIQINSIIHLRNLQMSNCRNEQLFPYSACGKLEQDRERQRGEAKDEQESWDGMGMW